MRIRFLGKESSQGDSPTLYATDRDTYIVQGYVVTRPEILDKLEMPEDETCVEIYARLMNHLAKDGLAGAVTSWAPPIVHVMEDGNYIVQGKRVSDSVALAEMAIPDHEDCVEVSKAALAALLEENDRGADDA
jgi:hypothetical protein